MIVATHSDERERREVSAQQARSLADKIGAFYVETSSVTGENVGIPFLTIATQVWRSSVWREQVAHQIVDEARKQKELEKKKCSLQ